MNDTNKASPNPNLRDKAIKGALWTYAQQFGKLGIQFVTSIILARLLEPEEFGIIGMLMIFTQLANILVNSGLTQSLIRKKDVDDEDFSTVFLFNLGVSILLYIIIFYGAPLISKFYDEPLTDLIRVLALTFIINALSVVQITILTKNLEFKRQTYVSFAGMIASGIIGISLALMGFGVWSLIYSQIGSVLVSGFLFWVLSNWKPKLVFNKEKFISHFQFGYKLALTSIIDTVYLNAYNILIGKFYSSASLGYYTRAYSLRQLPLKTISSSLNKVTFPLFSKIEDNLELKRVFKKFVRTAIFLTIPLFLFLIIMAEPVIILLLSGKWAAAVPYFQILCLAGIFYPLNAFNINLLYVKGKSDLFLKIEITKKVLLTLTIICSYPFGITGLLWGQVVFSLMVLPINMYYSGKFISYGLQEQFKDILPIITLAFIGMATTYFFDHWLYSDCSPHIRIFFSCLINLTIFIGFARLFKLRALADSIALAKRIILYTKKNG